MESIPKLFRYLNQPLEFQTNFEENRLKYKHIFVDERHQYMQELDSLFDEFRLEYLKTKQTVNDFDLLAQVSNIIDKLINYYYDEVLWYKPQITELPDHAEFERLEKKKYTDNQLHMLEKILEYEIRIAKKAKQYIVQQHSDAQPPPISSTVSIPEIPEINLKEPVVFEGEQGTLIALFYTLMQMKKLTFNKNGKYSTEQKHLEDFIQKNFMYKRGLSYFDVKHAEKALSDLRHQFEATADVATENIHSMIDDGIAFLKEYKEQLNTVSIRPKIKKDE